MPKFELKKLQLFENRTIAYLDEGDSDQVLLFLHGMGCSSAMWLKMLQELSTKFRCIAPDLPEHGQSYYTGESFSLTDLAEAIYHFIHRLSLNKQVVLIGHSMGAQLSFILSLRYPHLFSHLIVMAPAGIESFSKTEIKLIEMGSFMLNFFNTQNLSQLTGELKPQAKYFNVMRQSSRAMLNEPVHAFLSSIYTPTLIIFGTNDKFIPNPVTKKIKTTEIAQQAKRLIKGSSLNIIENKGHFLPLEAAKECNELIISFVQS